MKRLCDRLVCDCVAVESLVSMWFHAAGHCLAHTATASLANFFGGPIRRAGELHGAIAHSPHVRSAKLEVPDLSMRVMSGLLFRLFVGLTRIRSVRRPSASLFAHSALASSGSDRRRGALDAAGMHRRRARRAVFRQLHRKFKLIGTCINATRDICNLYGSGILTVPGSLPRNGGSSSAEEPW